MNEYQRECVKKVLTGLIYLAERLCIYGNHGTKAVAQGLDHWVSWGRGVGDKFEATKFILQRMRTWEK